MSPIQKCRRINKPVLAMKCRGLVTVKKTGAMCDQLLILEIGGPFRSLFADQILAEKFCEPPAWNITKITKGSS